MKFNLLFLLTFAIIFSGCESDDTSDIVININGGSEVPVGGVINLSGVYTSDLTLDANEEYLITGPVLMSAGTTLTIPAGMTIKAQPVGVNAYIAILQGAKINAEGTSSNPIVFTSSASSPASGNWGGIVLCGKAPINSTADGSTDTATTEVGGLSYGGNTPDDNSGILKYVRVEYAGGAIDGNAELNGVSVYAVGTGTTIDYVQVYKGSDDGFEFFGGTVNASHLAVVDAEDDSIDWTEGWTGSITDVYVLQNVGSSHDSGFECDGYNTDFSNEGGYVSNPTITNVTVIGDGDSGRAFRLRADTWATISNVIVENFGRGFVIEDGSDQAVIDGNLSATDVSQTAVETEFSAPTATAEQFFSGSMANATGTDYATWGAGWTVE
ncbi:multidrug transporter [Aegicerativicinus sediminis]|uniref:multidrug transporter n=1 Tax=Aegicerativicinus sediminis TaxID=2893202 RepID=UPI001E5248D2|nr:multidrug transporter [Aegicerativicinus sediminis]